MIAKGYNFEGSRQEIDDWVLQEIDQPLENPGMLYVPHPVFTDKVGAMVIYDRLKFPAVQDGPPIKVIEIAGIFNASDNPSRGLKGSAGDLLRKIVEIENPECFIGFTCNVSAMRLRSEVLGELGYTTKVGMYHLDTQWTKDHDHTSQLIFDRYVREHGGVFGVDGLVMVPRDYLEPVRFIPPTKLSSPYYEIYKSLTEAQLLMPEKKTASMLLTSMAVWT